VHVSPTIQSVALTPLVVTGGDADATEATLLRQAVQASREIIFMTDRRGLFTFVNRQFEETYGHAAADVVGRHSPRVLKGGMLEPEFYRLFWHRLVKGETVRGEFVNRARDGRLLTVDAVVGPTWNDTQTAIVGFLAIQRDISDRKRAEEDLRRKTLVLATEHDATADGILVIDEHGKVLSFNDQFLRMWGLPADALASGEDDALLNSALEKVARPEQFLERVRALYEQPEEVADEEIELRDGRTIHRHTAPMRDSEGRCYGRVWFFRDVTVRKRAERALLDTQAQLRRDALHDRLTGLPNRALLIDRLQQALVHARRVRRPVGVLSVDIDNFTLINDSLGHEAGDQLLVAVARRLEGVLRHEDTVARLGGDEFVILADLTESDTLLRRLAGRVQEVVQTPFSIGPHQVVLTLSVGIAMQAPDDRRTPDDLLRDADIAMNRAKKGGKGRYEVFTTAMHEEAIERFQVEIDLRRALANDEFVVVYQPIVDARTGVLTAVEALLRWQHPSRGLLSPAHFLTVAEEIGLLVPLGERVLRSACAQHEQWCKEGFRPVRVAVNVSPAQFRDPGLAAMVSGVLRDTNIDPTQVELELSENIVLTSGMSTAQQVQRLADTGARIALDDFGVVHTSVRFLAKFPITTLKIDQSFLADLSANQPAPIVVKALIALGHSLGLNVLIEGVETAEHKAFVQASDCDEMQGFHIGRPLSAEEVAFLLPAAGSPAVPHLKGNSTAKPLAASVPVQ